MFTVPSVLLLGGRLLPWLQNATAHSLVSSLSCPGANCRHPGQGWVQERTGRLAKGSAGLASHVSHCGASLDLVQKMSRLLPWPGQMLQVGRSHLQRNPWPRAFRLLRGYGGEGKSESPEECFGPTEWSLYTSRGCGG